MSSRSVRAIEVLGRRIPMPNVKDETRADERADDLNLGKMPERSRAMRTKVNSRALSLSAG